MNTEALVTAQAVAQKRIDQRRRGKTSSLGGEIMSA